MITALAGLAALLVVYGLVMTGLYLSTKDDLKLSEQQGTQARARLALAQKGLNEFQDEYTTLQANYDLGKKQYERVRRERDAYLAGLNRVTAMQTKGMANIGRKMSGAAHAALNSGRDA